MIEHDLDIETSDGLMNTFVTHPEEGGPFPVVLLLMDAMGKREELHDWARRIATVGYFVLLPNLFYRHARDYTPAWLDVENLEEREERMLEDINTLSNAMAVEDCKALLNYADQQVETNKGSAAVFGFSMSGSFAFAAAAEIPDRIKAAASINGPSLYTDTADSPHVNAEKISGEMYFACAEDDKHITSEMIESLDAYLKKININYRIEHYPGTVHGFYYPVWHEDFHKPSTERLWERLFAILKRAL
jgi:carboxymethylenebutenolidase